MVGIFVWRLSPQNFTKEASSDLDFTENCPKMFETLKLEIARTKKTLKIFTYAPITTNVTNVIEMK
jgi:hypothetical protein